MIRDPSIMETTEAPALKGSAFGTVFFDGSSTSRSPKEIHPLDGLSAFSVFHP
jgi:hypothetical protein